MFRSLSNSGFLLLFLLGWLIPSGTQGQNLEILGSYRIAVISNAAEASVVQGLYAGLSEAKSELEDRYTIEIVIERIKITDTIANARKSPQLQSLLNQAPDGVIIVAGAFGADDDALAAICAIGIPVIVVTSLAADSDRSDRLKTDESAAGAMAAEQLLNSMPRAGTIGILSSTADPIIEARLQAALAVIGNRHPHLIVSTPPDPHAAHDALRQTVAEDRNRRIRGWLFLDDWAFRGVVEALWDSTRAPAVSIMSHPSTTAALRSGLLAGVVLQPWQDWGHEALQRLIYQLHERADEREPIKDFPPQWYPRSDAAALESRWNTWLQQ